MHACPHCNAVALSNLAVRWSRRAYPARCCACANLSHVLASASNGIFGTGLVLFSFAVAASMMLDSYWVGASGLVLVLAQNVWVWRRVELFPIAAEDANSAARTSVWVFVVFLLARVFS